MEREERRPAEGGGRGGREKIKIRENERNRRGRRVERERGEEKKRAPVTVHEKTNSVILFGRRAKPSV